MYSVQFLWFYIIIGCCVVQSANLEEEEGDSPALSLLRRLIAEATKEKKAVIPGCPSYDEFKKLLQDKNVDKIPDKVCGDGRCSMAENPLQAEYGVNWYCVCTPGDGGTFCQYKQPCAAKPCKDGEFCLALGSEKLKYRNRSHMCYNFNRVVRALETLDQQ